MKVSIPHERKAMDAFGTKESERNFLEERQWELSFWRKGKIHSKQGNFSSNACSHVHVLIKFMLFFLVTTYYIAERKFNLSKTGK